MHVTISDNIPEALRYMSEAERSVLPITHAKALTFTAEVVKTVEYGMMQNVFDRPTPYTLNSLYVQPATLQSQTAEVYMKTGSHTPASNYLQPHVRGGGRGQKRSERSLSIHGLLGIKGYWVPGRAAKLDQYGNIRGSQWTKMLSDLRATSDPTQWRNKGDKPKTRGAVIRKQSRFFVPKIGHALAPGIYERHGTKLRKARPIAIFIDEVNYSIVFDFYGIADRIAKREFPGKFAKQLDLELSRLKTP